MYNTNVAIAATIFAASACSALLIMRWSSKNGGASCKEQRAKGSRRNGDQTSLSDEMYHKLEVVGGHASKPNKGPPILVSGSIVLKPFRKAGRGEPASAGEVEANFYADVTSTRHPISEFLPTYYGVVNLKGTHYLRLSNLLYGMDEPCILDLKMGQKTYSENASQEKVQRELRKFAHQKEMGFRITGMKVVRPAINDTWVAPRAWCMSISLNCAQSAIERFFFDGSVVRYDLVAQFSSKLDEIEKMLRNTRMWRLYGSSLLVVYDAKKTPPQLEVKMIDFCHVYEIEDGGIDSGYIHGIDILRKLLQSTLSNACANSSLSLGSRFEQLGGHTGSFEPCGCNYLFKRESDSESFDTEVAFYKKIWGKPNDLELDPVHMIVPKLIAVNETSKPRWIVISNDTALIAPPSRNPLSDEIVSLMDVKLGFKSYTRSCDNTPKAIYFSKYSTFEQSLAPGEAERIWGSICGSREGPSSLADCKLGKRDYHAFRDMTTTSAELGFRLTALSHVGFRVTQHQARSVSSLSQFLGLFERFLSNEHGFDSKLAVGFFKDLEKTQECLEKSKAVKGHELVGTSLLFLHYNGHTAIRWIDFGSINPVSTPDSNGVFEGVSMLRLAIAQIADKYAIGGQDA